MVKKNNLLFEMETSVAFYSNSSSGLGYFKDFLG